MAEPQSDPKASAEIHRGVDAQINRLVHLGDLSDAHAFAYYDAMLADRRVASELSFSMGSQHPARMFGAMETILKVPAADYVARKHDIESAVSILAEEACLGREDGFASDIVRHNAQFALARAFVKFSGVRATAGIAIAASTSCEDRYYETLERAAMQIAEHSARAACALEEARKKAERKARPGLLTLLRIMKDRGAEFRPQLAKATEAECEAKEMADTARQFMCRLKNRRDPAPVAGKPLARKAATV